MRRRRRLPPHGRRRIARACEASSSSISRAVPKIGRSRGQRVSRIRPLEIGSFSTPPRLPNTERPRRRVPPQPAAAAAARQATCQGTLGAPLRAAAAAGCSRCTASAAATLPAAAKAATRGFRPRREFSRRRPPGRGCGLGQGAHAAGAFSHVRLSLLAVASTASVAGRKGRASRVAPAVNR